MDRNTYTHARFLSLSLAYIEVGGRGNEGGAKICLTCPPTPGIWDDTKLGRRGTVVTWVEGLMGPDTMGPPREPPGIMELGGPGLRTLGCIMAGEECSTVPPLQWNTLILTIQGL